MARTRYEAIAAGDFEAYAEHDGPLADACAAVVGIGAGQLGPADIPQLDELVALETQSRRLLEAMMADASTSLAALRRHRVANGAYRASEPGL